MFCRNSVSLPSLLFACIISTIDPSLSLSHPPSIFIVSRPDLNKEFYFGTKDRAECVRRSHKDPRKEMGGGGEGVADDPECFHPPPPSPPSHHHSGGSTRLRHSYQIKDLTKCPECGQQCVITLPEGPAAAEEEGGELIGGEGERFLVYTPSPAHTRTHTHRHTQAATCVCLMIASGQKHVCVCVCVCVCVTQLGHVTGADKQTNKAGQRHEDKRGWVRQGRGYRGACGDPARRWSAA